MIQFDLPIEKSSIIKVIGVGGGGSNAVNYMFNQGIEGVNFVICNTDAQALAISGVPNRIQLGPLLTQGLGAGANPDIGRQATEESLEEVRRILEVNTKMVFVTAGMGGGTGTGGAPIIAKICKEMGILTVGIVTTPFAYEGKKRLQQAEEGVKQLRSQVDTLLIISNDKLRHQFGNLKMREAFEKADNVLATAARCITDVINSTGQINVDFADVCTVMRNGGRAILGHALVAGQNRAQLALEEALNSPLLSDNDILGAKWILININSARGEHEYTMDEVEIIQQLLLTRAGENTDVILGMGYDDNLGEQLAITLIATGFEHKDGITPSSPVRAKVQEEEKIVMVLGQPEISNAPVTPEANVEIEKEVSAITTEAAPAAAAPTIEQTAPVEESLPSALAPQLIDEDSSKPIRETEASFLAAAVIMPEPASIAPVVSGGYLTRPMNIYTEVPTQEQAVPEIATPAPADQSVQIYFEEEVVVNAQDTQMKPVAMVAEEVAELFEMKLVEKDEDPAPPTPLLVELHRNTPADALELPEVDESIVQQRRAAERLQKLRNLSFNVNAADPNNEFETIPAYIRQNMEMYNSKTQIENFYSNYEVKEDPNKQGPISSLNSFLNGEKPD
ncbi:MAG: cell division protein FtsZ [Bacteroidetes bacterium]|nr:cell division protein FtsZ [Bacteroidota bacterium]